MLIHGNEPQMDHIEFIEYTGKWPNLCSGVLVLKIDGKRETFGINQLYPRFWHPAGNYLSDISVQDEWAIDVMELPEQFRKYAEEIDNVFNNNVEYGHCGGCK